MPLGSREQRFNGFVEEDEQCCHGSAPCEMVSMRKTARPSDEFLALRHKARSTAFIELIEASVFLSVL